MRRENANMDKPAIDYTEKQIAIINAAQKLFAINGFDGTLVRDIANEASVNVA